MIFTAQYVNPGDRAFPSRFVSLADPNETLAAQHDSRSIALFDRMIHTR
jgi:hypothetical protein